MTDRPMVAKLNEAVDKRIIDENAFIEDIITKINQIILTLEECDPMNARTDIDLTQQQLSDIILRLSSITNMTDRTASIANIVKDHQLMRRPQTVQPPPPQAQLQTLPQAQLQTSPLQTQLKQSQSQIPLSQRPAALPINPAQLQQQGQTARKLGTRTMLSPLKGGRRTKRRRKTRR